MVLLSQYRLAKKMRKMTRRKRETSRYWELHHMLMSSDCVIAWKILQEPRPQTPIEHYSIGYTYTERLYPVPNQSPILMPSTPWPTMGTLFATYWVTKVIKKLQHMKYMDHTRLQVEHVIYAWESLTRFLTLSSTMHSQRVFHHNGQWTLCGPYT